MDELPTIGSLSETVIGGGFCIGCGACTAVEGSSFSMTMDVDGQYHAVSSEDRGDSDERSSKVCPFSAGARNEDEIGGMLYGRYAQYDEHVGFHLANYVGHVAEGRFRALGSSGGMGKWILAELLRNDLVDAVIHIGARKPVPEDPRVYGYTVITDADEVLEGSKSVYYPVQMSDALEHIRRHPGRYVVTGIPCFIKALRLLAEEEPVFKERIVFTVGLICGHLKSKRYADMIAWQFGVEPGNLASIDFRKKLPGARANEKGVVVKGLENEGADPEPDIVQNLFGTNYNHGFFQYNACNFCDDVVGETSDISVGDAWLEEYLEDGRGTNALVVRHPVIHQIVEDAVADGRLRLKSVSADTIAASQKGGFRQRREGLAYRLHLAHQKGGWRPPKRVAPSKNHISRKRRRIYELRMELTKRSHEAFREAVAARDFSVFRDAMQPLLDEYRELYKPTLPHRLRRGIARRLERFRAWLARRGETLFGIAADA